MGEAANVQQLSPEIVIGYVVIMDEKEESLSWTPDLGPLAKV